MGRRGGGGGLLGMGLLLLVLSNTLVVWFIGVGCIYKSYNVMWWLVDVEDQFIRQIMVSYGVVL